MSFVLSKPDPWETGGPVSLKQCSTMPQKLFQRHFIRLKLVLKGFKVGERDSFFANHLAERMDNIT